MRRIILLILVLALWTPAAAQAAANYETKVEWGVNFRAAPDTDARIYRMIPRGENIHVIGQVNKYWLNVQVQDGTIGYISSDPKYTDYDASAAQPAAGTIIKGVNFRSSPKVADNKIGFIKQGTVVTVLEQTNKWWVAIRHDGRTGYVSSDYISLSAQPGPNPSTGTGNGTVGDTADRIIADARSLIGRVTYEYGVRDPGRLIFDCSSFTEYVFEKNGIELKWGTRYQKDAGSAVARSKLRKGDLVFFGTSQRGVINHVGIYIGGGQFIHNSPSSDVAVSSLDAGYWADRYISARRVI